MYNYAHFLLIISFLFASICAFILYKHSQGKKRLLLFFLTLLGCLITFYSGWRSLKENQERQAELKAYTDGDPVIPQVRLDIGVDKQYYVFKLLNNSMWYSIYKMKVWAIPVSTDRLFIYDPDLPPVILTDNFLQPTAEVDTELEYDEIVINKNVPEWRFNFVIECKHGLFSEQLILRKVDGDLVEAIRIIKGDKIVYQTPENPKMLFPHEKKLVFQSPNEGFIKGSKREEYAKWKSRTKYAQY
jgi:hypothetical protein